MAKKSLIVGILLIFFFGGKFIFQLWRNTDTLINKIGCRVYELNELKVYTDEQVELDKIVIKEKEEIVFIDGSQTGKIRQEYGYRILHIYYEDELVAQIGNFNTN